MPERYRLMNFGERPNHEGVDRRSGSGFEPIVVNEAKTRLDSLQRHRYCTHDGAEEVDSLVQSSRKLAREDVAPGDRNRVERGNGTMKATVS